MSVRAYAMPLAVGWKAMPGMKPPPPPMLTFFHEKAARIGTLAARSSWRADRHFMMTKLVASTDRVNFPASTWPTKPQKRGRKLRMSSH